MTDEEKNYQTMTPGKAVFSFIIDMLLLVGGPFLIRDYLLPKYSGESWASYISTYLTNDVFNLIITLGCISAVTIFFKTLWKPGTRPHGLFNIVFAAFSTYYILTFFGGISALTTGDFGIISLAIMGYNISIDISLIGYAFLIQGGIAILLYLIEMIV
ncbi:MAG: hypothetical protein GF364_18765 [Candidatus Lokiarchaeota archaeon]|nr:hypothetical protein [Candidatus Lokiarchaeota archaeon]